jgi:FkbM family methyltransferase
MNRMRLLSAIRQVIIPNGSVQTVRLGPCRGLRYCVRSGFGVKFMLGLREKEEIRVCTEIVQQRNLVYDVGANIGAYAMLFSRLVGPSGKVIAFEPSPAVAKDLRANLALNGMANVDVVESAVGAEEGTARFDPVGGESAIGHVSASGSVTVKILALDGIGGDPDVIKIDVEGYESQVLLGSTKTIIRCQPLLLIELHTPEQDREVGRILKELRYTAYRLSWEPVRNMSEAWPDPDGMYDTVVAVPHGHADFPVH